jgi:hypothetical protein
MRTYPAQHRTRSFARVLGPFLTIVAVTVVLHASNWRGMVDEFTASALWPWVTGALVLLGGIAIVAFHQVWRGAAAIIVSALGWLLVVRGVFLLAFPAALKALADRSLDAVGLWTSVCAVMAGIGLYLTYVGWKPAPTQETERWISIDTSRAA